MATHSSTLAWKIPWTEEPGRLQSMGSLGVGYDWVTSLSLFTFIHWRRKWQPTLAFLPGESQGQPGGLPSMGSHRVRHDWSDLAAAVAANKCYPPLSTFSVPASELSICLSLLPGFRVKADLLRSLSWTRVTPTFLEGGKEQRGPVWQTGG